MVNADIMLFRAEGRENMVADRAYSPGLLASPDWRASLFYFAAAVPTVGFVHGAVDLSPLKAAALEDYAEDRFEDYAEDRFIKGAPRIETAARGNCSTTSPQSSRRWPLALRWLA
jgi:hypothetical protein